MGKLIRFRIYIILLYPFIINFNILYKNINMYSYFHSFHFIFILHQKVAWTINCPVFFPVVPLKGHSFLLSFYTDFVPYELFYLPCQESELLQIIVFFRSLVHPFWYRCINFFSDHNTFLHNTHNSCLLSLKGMKGKENCASIFIYTFSLLYSRLLQRRE